MRRLSIIALAGLALLTPWATLAQDEAKASTAEAVDPVSNSAGDLVGDPVAGRKVFSRCRACHNLSAGDVPKTGPNLDGLIGRTAGTSAGYDRYSKALKESGIVWTAQTINAWISDPDNFLPGNKMALAPVRSEKDRENLVAFLLEATSTK